MEIKKVRPLDIKPYYNNPRKNDDAVIKVAESIKAFGFQNPVIVDKKNIIIAGHTRWKAALKLNLKEIPIIITDLPEEKAKAYRIADNRVGEFANWDWEKLVMELENFDEDVKDLLDFEIPDEFTISEGLTDEDEIPDEPEAICKPGDIWQLGRHRLMCGDSTKAEDVDILLNGKKKYSILTDPPYNISFNYNRYNDKLTDKEYSDFCKKWFNNFTPTNLILTPGPKNEKYYPEPRDKGIWIKRNATSGASCFNLRLCEPILFYGKFKEKRNTDLFDYSSGFTNELKEAQQKSGVSENHAPAKSVKLWVELIEMLDNLVIDNFLGNGTTLIAAEKTNRTCYGMEIDPHYCDVIIERWQKYTGKKAVKLNGEKHQWKHRKRKQAREAG